LVSAFFFLLQGQTITGGDNLLDTTIINPVNL